MTMLEQIAVWMSESAPVSGQVAKLILLLPVVLGAAYAHELTHFLVARLRGYDAWFGPKGLSVCYDLDPDKTHIDHAIIGSAPQIVGSVVGGWLLASGQIWRGPEYEILALALGWVIFTLNGRDDVAPVVDWGSDWIDKQTCEFAKLPRWEKDACISIWVLAWASAMSSILGAPVVVAMGSGAIPSAFFAAQAGLHKVECGDVLKPGKRSENSAD